LNVLFPPNISCYLTMTSTKGKLICDCLGFE
jgi:hypothetical protein